MRYSDIIKTLPVEVVTDLQENLESIPINDLSTMPRAEVVFLINEAVKLTKLGDGFSSIADSEKRRMVEMVLSFVPEAAVSMLFA